MESVCTVWLCIVKYVCKFECEISKLNHRIIISRQLSFNIF